MHQYKDCKNAHYYLNYSKKNKKHVKKVSHTLESLFGFYR